ncbi:amino acid adenylation domain-containing protein [Micromonospora echinospora]|uniref:Amino acid adenylation domain-containing protein n=1 Tax=Micromonospora echinospora TaxID=1877 RepID=A0A1C4Z7I9_MICEC|nr:non-ribosomal peptide synthetase [Micromonospora echinospora]SCF28933.1 amino acid adenylation domain-containing protein [Micromonospora echinospora]
MGTAEATYAQHAVWFTEQAGVAGTAYHMALGVRFGAELDRSALVEACAVVTARHPVLATRVVADHDGTPRLVPADGRPAVTFGELTDDRTAEEIARRYDPASGPLSRFTLLTGADGTHLLLVTAHHLVFDGMSKDVLVRDLAAAYAAALTGTPAEFAPTDDGYPAHATAERERVEARLPDARAYWERHWSGPGDVVLPGLRRVPTAAEPGATVEVGLPGELVEGVDRTARSLGVTRFEVLLAVVHALLARYGNRDVPVGVGLSTRTAAQADQVGLFVNELPVGVAPATGDVAGYVRAVRARLRELYRFRDVPLAHAVSGLRPAPALTPVSVGYRRRGAEPTFTGVSSRVEWTLFGGAARNALHVQIVDAPTGLTVGLQYSPAAIDADSVDRIGGHLRTMLAAVVTDPGQPVAGLPLLPAGERDRVLRSWNDTGRTYPLDATVPALVAERVRTDPDAVAVVDGDRTLTYAQLDAASARLAGLLGDRGVGPGTLVAVALDRSWSAVVTLLAVLRRRAAYLPVDPGHPVARQELVLADAAPALVVTTAATGARLDPARPVLVLDGVDLDAPAGADDVPPADPPTADDLAYVLYTSGSTGRPKGVAVRHGALANLLLAVRDTLDSRPEHRWLHLTSLSFDISGVEIFLPLVTGGRVVVASAVSALDGAGVLRLVRDAGVTHVQATPSGWRVLLEAGLGGTPDAVTPEPLVAVTGGEALPVTLARDLRARVDRLVNGYGPTEATIYATMADIPADPDEVTIGRPLPNTRAYLLDDDLRPVPVGLPGELCLAGAGLAAGYLGRDDLTAERFVTVALGAGEDADAGGPDGNVDGPVGATGGVERIYRTGDRCRWQPDGRIAYLGRADDQVKIRGHRVELGEITARLLDHPTVAEAVVLLHDPVDGDPRLVAYLVPRPGAGAPEPADLRGHLALTLPPVMLPADWVVLDRLPVGPNGKVDRAALPAPSARDTAVAAESATAVDPLVETLQEIWQDVLKIPDIGPHEDLFDLGGHSLTITRISGRIVQRLGVEVPLDAFFDTPTIAEIAEIIRQSGEEF